MVVQLGTEWERFIPTISPFQDFQRELPSKNANSSRLRRPSRTFKDQNALATVHTSVLCTIKADSQARTLYFLRFPEGPPSTASENHCRTSCTLRLWTARLSYSRNKRLTVVWRINIPQFVAHTCRPTCGHLLTCALEGAFNCQTQSLTLLLYLNRNTFLCFFPLSLRTRRILSLSLRIRRIISLSLRILKPLRYLWQITRPVNTRLPDYLFTKSSVITPNCMLNSTPNNTKLTVSKGVIFRFFVEGSAGGVSKRMIDLLLAGFSFAFFWP